MADKTETKTAKAEKQQGKDGAYYLVNPAGAIHNVDKEHARYRLASPGWRLATEAEIVLLQNTRTQRFDRPLCKPWTPDPDEQIKLPGEE